MEDPENRETRRREILDLDPETRKGLAEIIRGSLLKIPGEIAQLTAQLQEQERNMVQWLTEFAPDLLPEQYRGD